ncbi:uncharacterized protein EDB91DRAFT_1269360 [Suillus paluster]|uniref:uncharacterized protein n=1 Tax=Suillus paluster TaxID=48578 RepID=UPI001B876BFA|nr:uncharacterized protein EDB91DRAFT_1269360 [Suillus paluster]KAG1724206.1 hypothetical protein EDB91DRAFT_1269360 [Suillus paluster]
MIFWTLACSDDSTPKPLHGGYAEYCNWQFWTSLYPTTKSKRKQNNPTTPESGRGTPYSASPEPSQMVSHFTLVEANCSLYQVVLCQLLKATLIHFFQIPLNSVFLKRFTIVLDNDSEKGFGLLKHTLVRTAIKNSAVFEINYAGAIGGKIEASLSAFGVSDTGAVETHGSTLIAPPTNAALTYSSDPGDEYNGQLQWQLLTISYTQTQHVEFFHQCTLSSPSLFRVMKCLIQMLMSPDGFNLSSEADKASLLQCVQFSLSQKSVSYRVLLCLISALQFVGVSAATVVPLVLQFRMNVTPNDCGSIIIAPPSNSLQVLNAAHVSHFSIVSLTSSRSWMRKQSLTRCGHPTTAIGVLIAFSLHVVP